MLLDGTCATKGCDRSSYHFVSCDVGALWCSAGICWEIFAILREMFVGIVIYRFYVIVNIIRCLICVKKEWKT